MDQIYLEIEFRINRRLEQGYNFSWDSDEESSVEVHEVQWDYTCSDEESIEIVMGAHL